MAKKYSYSVRRSDGSRDAGTRKSTPKNPTLSQIRAAKDSGVSTTGKTRSELGAELQGAGSSSTGGNSPDTLASAVVQEQQRLAEKYPGSYTPSDTSTKNIARNLIQYGSPISPSNRSISSPNQYRAYTGPSAQETLLELKGGVSEAGKRIESGNTSGVVATGTGMNIVGRQLAYTRASARIDPVTGEVVSFGGGMAGENIPDAYLRRAGLEALFYNRAVRKAEQESDRSLRRDFSGFKDAVEEVGIDEVMDYREGSVLTVVEKPQERLTREQEAKIWRDLGVYDRQSFYDAQRQQPEIVESSIGPSGFSLLQAPGLIKGVPVKPTGLGVRVSGFGKVETVESFDLDLSDLESAKEISENYGGLPNTNIKIPLFTEYVERPIYRYTYAEFEAAEIEKRSALMNAKTEAEREQIQARYTERIAGITDPLNVRITAEGAGPKYSRNPNPLLMVGEELVARFNRGDIPIVDVKLSPAAVAVLTGGLVGVSVGAPVGATAASTGGGAAAMAYAGATGAAQVTVAYSVSTEVREATGSTGVGVLAGAASAGAVSYGSQVLKAKIAPFNRAEIIANTQKTTDLYSVGQQRLGTTLSKDIYQGSGKNVPPEALRSMYRVGSGLGTSAGKELPVFVRLSSRLGETKVIPTYSAKAYFSSAELGMGRSLAAESYFREVAPRVKGGFPAVKEAVPYGKTFVESGVPGLKVPRGAGYKLPGQVVGSQRPSYNQAVVSTYQVGSGKSANLFATAFKGQVKVKNVFRVTDTKTGVESSLDLFKLKGRGFVSEFGKKPSAPFDVKVYGVKSTVLKGNVATGSEAILAKIGRSVVEKYAPRYSEVFRKTDVGAGGGSGGGVIQSGGGGSSQVLRINIGSNGLPVLREITRGSTKNFPSSFAKDIVSGPQQTKVVVGPPVETYGASMLNAVSRGAAAEAYVASQLVRPSFSLNIPLLISQPTASYSSDFKGVISQGQVDIQEQHVSSLALHQIPASVRNYSERQKQYAILETFQRQTQPSASAPQPPSVNVLQRQNLQQLSLKQKTDLVQETLQIQEQKTGLLSSSISQVPNQSTNIPGFPSGDQLTPKIPPGLGGSGWSPGGGGRGKSQIILGTRYDLKNPWPDVEEFAEKVFGSEKKKRRKKK